MYGNTSSLQLASECWSTFNNILKTEQSEGNLMVGFIVELYTYNQFSSKDFYSIFLIFLLICMHQYMLKNTVLKNIGDKLHYKKEERRKLEENGCSLSVYIIFAIWEMYLVSFKYKDLLNDSTSHWQGWKLDMVIPREIKYLYYSQIAYYCYSAYSILFVDVWRKDSIAMIIHHVIANSLIIFSMAVRFHRIGLVVLFLHDIADIFICFAKICDSITKKLASKIFDISKNISFILFTLCWVVNRLYIYPHVVLYSSCHVSVTILQRPHFYVMFNSLLFLLYGLNIYWSYFIVMCFARLFNAKDMVDTREYELTEANLAKLNNEFQKNKAINQFKHS